MLHLIIAVFSVWLGWAGSAVAPAPLAEGTCPGSRPIADARQTPLNTVVTVRGVVTVPSGTFNSDRSFALQDATGGLYVFRQAGLGQTLRIGDDVCVTGRLSAYRGLLEVLPSQPRQIIKLGAGSPLAAQPVRARDLGPANEGRLVTVAGEVTRLGAQRFWLSGAEVYVYESTGIAFSGLLPGCAATVTGLSAAFEGPQLWPRTQADIVLGDCPAAPVTALPPVHCPDVTIAELQGAGRSSPFDPERRWACLSACVTGVTAEGFFVQSEAADAQPETSEGIYVYRFSAWQNPRGLRPGQRVTLQGFGVQEFYDQTEIVGLMDDTVASYAITGECSLPEAVPLAVVADPAADPVAHYEAVEGMRVRVDLDSSVIGPTTRYVSRYPPGDPEIAVVARKSPFYGQRVLARDLPAGYGALTLSGALGVDLPAAGVLDRLTAQGLTGVLAYRFGQYVLLVDDPAPLRVEDVSLPAPSASPARADETAFCSFNVENLFDAVDDGDGDMGDWTPVTAAAAEARIAALGALIRERLQGCAVVGLQEVEGKDAVWAALAAAAGPQYRYDYFESLDARDITVGILYDADRVLIQQAMQPLACGPQDYGVNLVAAVGPRSRPQTCPPQSYLLFDRPPYLVDLVAHDVSGAQQLALRLVVVHLKSKRGEEADNLPRRSAQARFVADLLDRPLAVALGDFNDGLGSEPLAQFSGLVNLYLRHLPVQAHYSYIYQGRAEAIDHFVMTPRLDAYFLAGGPLHLNADYPETLAGSDGARVSDHDPLYVRFAFRPTAVSAALLGAVSAACQP